MKDNKSSVKKNDSKKEIAEQKEFRSGKNIDKFEQAGMRPLTDEQLDIAIGGIE